MIYLERERDSDASLNHLPIHSYETNATVIQPALATGHRPFDI